MKLLIFDNGVESARFVVNIGVDKFILSPEITDPNFLDMKDYTRYIIGRYLSRYLMRDEDFTDTEIMRMEHEIIEELHSIAMREIIYYNRYENKKYHIEIYDI